MTKFKAKMNGTDTWIEGTSLIETSCGYVIMSGNMEWYDGSEWSSRRNSWDYIEIETLIIEKTINSMENEIKGSIEWLQIQLKKGIGFNPLDPLSYPKAVDDIFEKAKEMEKQQRMSDFIMGITNANRMEATKDAEQWYNETYGGNI
jgi:hypothetical protein